MPWLEARSIQILRGTPTSMSTSKTKNSGLNSIKLEQKWSSQKWAGNMKLKFETFFWVCLKNPFNRKKNLCLFLFTFQQQKQQASFFFFIQQFEWAPLSNDTNISYFWINIGSYMLKVKLFWVLTAKNIFPWHFNTFKEQVKPSESMFSLSEIWPPTIDLHVGVGGWHI